MTSGLSDTGTSPAALSDTRSILADFVGQRAALLQSGYQADSSAAVATLAQLRRIVPRTDGVDPYAWAIFEEMPERLLGHSDHPGRAELAAIAALTLFATHQQSRRDMGMHAAGRDNGLGRAVGRLSRATRASGVSGVPSVERRFRALTRAADLSAAVQHLRGLVGQLRSERIPLDYRALARDLYDVQRPQSLPGVRMRWIRDFHRSSRDVEVAGPTTPTGEQK